MGQYKSYKSMFLNRKLNKLQKELTNFKAKQLYGMNDIQIFESNVVTISTKTFNAQTYDGQFSYTASGTNIIRLRFVGNKPGKTVVGNLKYEFDVKTQGEYYEMTFVKGYRGSEPHILEWILCAGGGSDGFGARYSVFDVNMKVLSNEVGILSVVDTYDIATYYQWVYG